MCKVPLAAASGSQSSSGRRQRFVAFAVSSHGVAIFGEGGVTVEDMLVEQGLGFRGSCLSAILVSDCIILVNRVGLGL